MFNLKQLVVLLSIGLLNPVIAQVPTGEGKFVPSNNRCVNALPLVIDEALNGTTLNATFETTTITGNECGSRTDRQAVWFSFTGTGKKSTVSVCSFEDDFVDFGIVDACNTQEACVGFPPSKVSLCSDGEFTMYELETTSGVLYRVNVRTQLRNGNFTILWEEEDTKKDDGSSAPSRMSLVPFCFIPAASLWLASLFL